MRKIRIIKTPPGLAADQIREQWVGIEIQLAPRDEAAKALADLSPKSASAGGYVVRGMDAVESLYQAGKHDAAAYWDIPVPPPYLVFARDCCELV